MYVIYLFEELYGFTDSKEKAYKTIYNFLTTKFKGESFLNELIDNLNNSLEIDPEFLNDGANCCAYYSKNVF